MYVGEWFKGKTMGKGTFSWPSGAMYEGNFKSGFMDGEGIYTGAIGGTYKGSWVMNLKHGFGIKDYPNGDVYEGEWSRGSQEGHGKYTWKLGTTYVGEWKNGKICGQGKMSWPNGNVYEGDWDEGLPKGNGTFRWEDGSSYVGNWSSDPEEQNGTYYPSAAHNEGGDDALEWDPQQVFSEDLKECKICPTEKIPMWPSQKKLAVWRSTKGGAEPSVRHRRMSVDGRIDSGVDRDLGGMRLSDGAAPSAWISGEMRDGDESSTMSPVPIKLPQIAKRQGETISKGHRNYDLMLNLQLGIRYMFISLSFPWLKWH